MNVNKLNGNKVIHNIGLEKGEAMRLFFALIGFSAAIFCSCGYTVVKISDTESRPVGPPPGWPVQYPSSRYLTGIGVSSTSWGMWVALQRASDDARAEIARTIESRVESRRELFMRSSSSSGHLDDRSNRILRAESHNLSSFTRVSTDQIVSGIEFKEKHHDQSERVLYVLAALDRVAASERLERQIKEFDYRTALLREQARKQEGAQDLLVAAQLYRKALGASLQADVLRQQASVLDPRSESRTDSRYSSAELAVKLGALLGSMELSITGNRLGAIEGAIQQAMAGAGFSVRESSAKSTGLTLRCNLNTTCYPVLDLNSKQGSYMCLLSLGVKIVDNRTGRIAGETILLANSNAGNQASARDRALRLLRREVKEKLLEAFYEALSIKASR